MAGSCAFDIIVPASIAEKGADAAKSALSGALASVPIAILELLNEAYWGTIKSGLRSRGRVTIRVQRWYILFIAHHAIEIGPPSTAYYKPAGGADPFSFK